MATTETTDASGGVSRADMAAYFAVARSWDADKVQSGTKARRLLGAVASVASLIAALEAIALVVLMPLKTVEPMLVRVDSATGIVDNVVRLRDARPEAYDEVMTKYFLRRVVTLRETYTRAQLQSNYDQVMLFTAPSARLQLKNEFDFSNLDSPYRRYGDIGVATIQIVNVSFISRNVAQVRYLRTERRVDGAETQGRWVATVDFRYVSQPAGEEARAVNPLGFQVVNYRNDPEAVIGAKQ